MKQKAKPATFDRESGPLTSVIPCNESRILDHMVVFESFDYSTFDISRIVRIKHKRTLDTIHRLEKTDIIKKARMRGKTATYQLNSQSSLAKLIKTLLR